MSQGPVVVGQDQGLVTDLYQPKGMGGLELSAASAEPIAQERSPYQGVRATLSSAWSMSWVSTWVAC